MADETQVTSQISDSLLKTDITECATLLETLTSTVSESGEQIKLLSQKLRDLNKLGSVNDPQNQSFQYIDVKSMLLLNY